MPHEPHGGTTAAAAFYLRTPVVGELRYILMKKRTMLRIHPPLCVLLLATLAACSSSESTPDGAGGAPSPRGGSPGVSTGGAPATGTAGTGAGGLAGAFSTAGSASGGSGPSG